MKNKLGILFLSLSIIIIFSTEDSLSQWPKSGLPVCTHWAMQTSPLVVADRHGSVVMWTDMRSGSAQLFAQRLDHAGNKMWEEDGILVVSVIGSVVACSDGEGGAIIAWSYDDDIYAQRIRRDGTFVCPPQGCLICGAAERQVDVVISPDLQGGAYLAWDDSRWFDPEHPHDENFDIYYQRIDSLCVNQFGSAGIGGENESNPRIATSSDGGLILAYKASSYPYEYRNEVVKRFSDGSYAWSVPVTDWPYGYSSYSVVSDWSGGAVSACNGKVDRINAAGEKPWGEEGVMIYGYGSELIPDRAGGAYQVGNPQRILRIDSTGTLPWGTGGKTMTPPFPQDDAQFCSLEDGSAGIAYKIQGFRICVQGIDREGFYFFPDSSREIEDVITRSFDVAASPDSCMLVVWRDRRNDNYDIYIYRMDRSEHYPVLAQVGDQVVDEGSVLAIQLEADDLNPDDILTFSTDAGSVLPSPFSFDGSTGLFLWIPQAGDVGCYDVSFSVSDGYFTDSEKITIDVTVDGNHPPVISVPSIVYFWEGPVVIEASAQDPEGDTLTFFINDPRYTVEGGTLTWMTMPADSGVYHPVVSVTDGALSDSATVTVKVYGGEYIFHDHCISNEGAWVENDVAWINSLDGYLRADTVSWNSAVISRDMYSAEDGLMVITRINTTSTSNYIFGFTRESHESTDFHSDGIELGVYVHSSMYYRTIRPSWSPDDTDYWDKRLGMGIYDIRILLDDAEDLIQIDVEWVPAYDAPLSNFYQPDWKAVESRAINGDYSVQVNPYNATGFIFDIWIYHGHSKVATEMAGWSLILADGFPLLEWTLSRSSDAEAVLVLRRKVAEELFSTIAKIPISPRRLSYSLTDSECEQGETYIYRLAVEEKEGIRILLETEQLKVPALELTLRQNYPNPFNPVTTIGYYLPMDAHATIDIYDVSGRKIKRLLDRRQEKGPHSAIWDGTGVYGTAVSSGIYFYVLRVGKQCLSRKLVLIR